MLYSHSDSDCDCYKDPFSVFKRKRTIMGESRLPSLLNSIICFCQSIVIVYIFFYIFGIYLLRSVTIYIFFLGFLSSSFLLIVLFFWFCFVPNFISCHFNRNLGARVVWSGGVLRRVMVINIGTPNEQR